jgi:GNAT superfamily N-acetyltransferase
VLTIDRFQAADRESWERLFRAYIAFYERSLPDEEYERAWLRFQADTEIHGIGARDGGQLLGIAHFLTHPHTNAADVCYLQDLFTAPDARGHGVGRALIAAVVQEARVRDCSRVYWMTHETNTVARALYDKVALNAGFIRYQIEL